MFRFDGTFEPWLVKLSERLLELYPLPTGVTITPETIPNPRVQVAEGGIPQASKPSLVPQGYLLATVVRNKRITAQDWYQDVRHLELTFDDDIEYVVSSTTLSPLLMFY